MSFQKRLNVFKLLLLLFFIGFAALAPVMSAIELDGVDDYIDIGSPVTLTSNARTLVFWANANDWGSNSSSIIFNSTEFGLSAGTFTSGTEYMIFRTNSGNQSGFSTSHLVDSTWHHFVVSVNSSDTITSMYLDSLVQSVDIGSGWVIKTGSLIGARNKLSSELEFGGKIDDVRIYNRALSASEVEALYKSRKKRLSGSLANGLIAHYEMDGGEIGSAVSTVIDSTGNSNHGTGAGGASLIYEAGVLKR